MIKKLGMAIAAFAIGLFVSLSIQACAEKVDTGTTKVPAAQTHIFDAWKQPGLEYAEEYFENGTLACRTDYKYDENGWILEETYYGYGDKVYSTRSIRKYTYSDSGDCQYCTIETKYYNNGTVYDSNKYSSVRKLNISK